MQKSSKQIAKECAICGKEITVFLYPNKTIRGGHYFGKVPLYTKAEMARASKGGSHQELVGDWAMNIMNIEPKPYGQAEYWECPTCYWGK